MAFHVSLGFIENGLQMAVCHWGSGKNWRFAVISIQLAVGCC